MKKIFIKRGAGLLLSGLLLTTSLFGAACTNSGAATGSEAQPETSVAAGQTQADSTAAQATAGESAAASEVDNGMYQEVLALYFEAPNQELLDTLYHSLYASALRVGEESKAAEALPDEKEQFDQLKEWLQRFFSDEGIQTYVDDNTLLLKYQTIVEEINAETKLGEITFEPSDGALNWKGTVTLSHEGTDQVFNIEGNFSLDEDGRVRYINSEGDGGLMDACKQIYQQNIDKKESE